MLLSLIQHEFPTGNGENGLDVNNATCIFSESFKDKIKNLPIKLVKQSINSV